MNINDLTITGTQNVNITDSLNAPILKLKLTLNENTTIPETNTLEIYVEKDTENIKTYTYNLTESLTQTDTFIIEPTIIEGKIKLKTYITRQNGVEELTSQNIILYEGTNVIYTNYTNANIEVIYPKNIDTIKYFLNNTLYLSDNETLTLDDLFFKDSFTEVDGLINAEFNELKAKCLTSTTGNFRLDSMGNLTVNSIITTGNTNTNQTLDFNQIYPIGSIYMSVNNVNPSILFGGVWEQIQDTFLLAAGTSYQAGTTGGNSAHSHTYAHTHGVPGVAHNHGLASGYACMTIYMQNVYARKKTGLNWSDTYWMSGSTYSVNSSGNNTTGAELGGTTDYTTPSASTTNSQSNSTTDTTSNMPPYLAVYVWKRTA